jgi:hypothetical protein
MHSFSNHFICHPNRHYFSISSGPIRDTETGWRKCHNEELHHLYSSILLYSGSTALCWALAAFFSFLIYTQSVALPGRGISPSQGLYLHTG